MNGFCPLASGSKGNSLYLGFGTTKLLFDVGISFKSLKERLDSINVDVSEIDAVIISHEHSDHIKGLDQLIKKTNVPVFANSDTAKQILSAVTAKPKFKIFSTGETFFFGDFEIHPFSIQHDTLDPVAFTVKFDNKKLGICTDLGFATTLVATHLKDCDYLYIESNHDEDLVHASPRSHIYKQRVLSRQGHLSNHACATLVSHIHHDGLKRVYLAHLSSDCNSSDLAIDTVKSFLEQQQKIVDLSIAYQHSPSDPVFF